MADGAEVEHGFANKTVSIAGLNLAPLKKHQGPKKSVGARP